MRLSKQALLSIICAIILVFSSFGTSLFARGSGIGDEIAAMTVLDDCNNFSKVSMMHELRYVSVYNPALYSAAANFDAGDVMLTNSRDANAHYPVTYIWNIKSEAKIALIAYYHQNLILNGESVASGKALTFSTSEDRVSDGWVSVTPDFHVLEKMPQGDFYKVAFIIPKTAKFGRYLRVIFPTTGVKEILITQVKTEGGVDETNDEFELVMNDTLNDLTKASSTTGPLTKISAATSSANYGVGDLELHHTAGGTNVNSNLTWAYSGSGAGKAVVKVRYAYSFWKTDGYGFHLPGQLKDTITTDVYPKLQYSIDGTEFFDLTVSKYYWEPIYGISSTVQPNYYADLLVNVNIYRQSYDMCNLTVEDIPKGAKYFRFNFPVNFSANYVDGYMVALSDVKLFRKAATPEPNPGLEQEIDDMLILDNCNNFSRLSMMHELRFVSVYNPAHHSTTAHFDSGDVMLTNSRDLVGNYPVSYIWSIKSKAKIALIAYYHKDLIVDAQNITSGKALTFSTSEDRVSAEWKTEAPEIHVLEKMSSEEYYKVAFMIPETARYGRYLKVQFPNTLEKQILITQVRTEGGADEINDDFVLVKHDTLRDLSKISSSSGYLSLKTASASDNGNNVDDLDMTETSGGTNITTNITWEYAGVGAAKAIVKVRYAYTFWATDSWGISIPGQLKDGSPDKVEPKFQYSINGTDFYNLTVSKKYWEPTYGISGTVQPSYIADLLTNVHLQRESYDMCNFTINNIPEGAKYFRFYFPESYADGYSVSLSDVKIFAEDEYIAPPVPQPNPDPQIVAAINSMPVIDDCDNFNKVAMMHELRFVGLYDPKFRKTEEFFDKDDVMITNSRDVLGPYPVSYIWNIKSEAKVALIAYYKQDAVINGETIAAGKQLLFSSSEDRSSTDWIEETPQVHVLELMPGNEYYKVAFVFNKTEKYSRYFRVIFPYSKKDEALITTVKASGGIDEVNPEYPYIFSDTCADINNKSIVDSNGTLANEIDEKSDNGSTPDDLDRYTSYPANGGSDVYLTWAMGGSGEGKAVVKIRYVFTYWELDGWGIHKPEVFAKEFEGLYDFTPIFYASEDGEEFIPLEIKKTYWEPTYGVGDKTNEDQPMMGNLLTNMVIYRESYDMCYYTIEGIPEDARFFKMVFPPMYANSWDVRLSDVKIYRTSATNLPPLTDDELDLGIIDDEDVGEDYFLEMDDPDEFEASPDELEPNVDTGDREKTTITLAFLIVQASAMLSILTFSKKKKQKE